MRYSRQDCCALAAIDDERFKTMVRRQQIPVPHSPRRSGSARRSDAAFSEIDILVVAVGEAIRASVGQDRGLPADSAMRLALAAREYIERAFKQRMAGGDLWAGIVVGRVFLSSRSFGFKTAWYVGGSLSDVMTQIEREQGVSGEPVRVFAVNISAVIREVIERADHAGIPFAA
ncbi:hypothetical protein [Pseudorhodoplanes sp.]|uniref:hypothetical protein n=1 Tax=Pseudorhodoplanes sp. TaxID=1934341 RepID=UPI00391B9672